MISRAPMRISFGGGNTDLEPFRSKFGGTTFGVAIKKYASASPTFDNNVSPLVLAIKEKMSYSGNLGIHVDAPPMSGLGASGAIAVACVYAIAPGKLSRKKMASLAFDVERKDLGILGGEQDQVASAFGGMFYIEFNANSEYEIIPVPRDSFTEDLEKRLVLVYLGDRSQSGANVLEDIIHRDKEDILLKIKEIATEQRRCITHGDLIGFAELLRESWKLKRELSPFVSNPKIDEVFEEVAKNGALAAKLSGAGSGGFAMILCDNTSKVMDRLRYMEYKPESVEFDWDGASIVRSK